MKNLTCRTCSEAKPETAFALRADTGRRRTECLACQRERMRAWRQANPERFAAGVKKWKADNPERVAAIRLRERCKLFGITEAEYRTMRERQRGLCAMCGKPEEDNGGRLFAIDHDHACCPESGRSCGRCVRGLLCSPCNIAVGYIESEVLMSMVREYLAGKNPVGPG